MAPATRVCCLASKSPLRRGRYRNRRGLADEEIQPFVNEYGDTLDAAYLRVTQDVRLRRPATAEEIASVCDFLISDYCRYQTHLRTLPFTGRKCRSGRRQRQVVGSDRIPAIP